MRCIEKRGSVDTLLKSVLFLAPCCAYRLACSLRPRVSRSELRPLARVCGRAPCLVHGVCVSLPGPGLLWLAFTGGLLGWGCHSVACSDTLGGVDEATLVSIGPLFPAVSAVVSVLLLVWELRRLLRGSALGLVRLGPHSLAPRGRWFSRQVSVMLGALLCAGAGSATRPALGETSWIGCPCGRLAESASWGGDDTRCLTPGGGAAWLRATVDLEPW